MSILTPKNTMPPIRPAQNMFLRGLNLISDAYRNHQKDGAWIWLEGRCATVRDAVGRVARLLLASHDIPARKQMEAALRESEEQFRTLFEQANDGMLLADVETKRFLLANPQIQKRLGYSKAELLQLTVPDIHPAADLPRVIEGFEQQSRGETTAVNNLPVLCKDGAVFYADVRSARCTLQGRHCILGVFRDITERKQLEAEIQHVSEIEKQRLGRDLHDGLCQQLTGVRYLASALAASLAQQALPEAADAAKIVGELANATAQTHDLARGLFPVELQRGDIVLALQQLATMTASLFKISCQVVAPYDIHLADTDAARQLYRIAQEAINNAAKHSHGQHIVVRLVVQQGRLHLTVQDDGVGISQHALERADMGLRIMQYRAGILNANLTIVRAPSGGTLVTCALVHSASPHRRALKPKS
jgi:PAS domain S-box-containing protein